MLNTPEENAKELMREEAEQLAEKERLAEHEAEYGPDTELTAEQLDDKYNLDGDGEHPEHTIADWMEQVDHGNTLSGYWEWVAHMLVG